MNTATAADELPRWASDILAATPARGDGLNRWLLKASIALRRCGRSEHEMQASLAAATADQPVKHGEIERAVQRSESFMSDGLHHTPGRSTWTTEKTDLRSKIIEQSGGIEVADLWERSPHRLTNDGHSPKLSLTRCFPEIRCSALL